MGVQNCSELEGTKCEMKLTGNLIPVVEELKDASLEIPKCLILNWICSAACSPLTTLTIGENLFCS